MAGVAGLFKRVVQVAHEFGRLNVDRVLILEGAFLHAQNETELFDMVGQVGQSEKRAFPLVQVPQLKGLEVADQNVTGTVLLGQGVEVVAGLFVGFGQVVAGAFLLNQEDTGPEQVDEARTIVQLS